MEKENNVLEFLKAEQFLEKVCKENNIEINEDIKLKLRKYYELLIEWNEKINLTAITNLEEVYEKHFADSVVGCKHIKSNSTLCDIGTGAGFPGLVIAIFREDVKVVLVDALNKRVNFLNNVANNLGLNNVKVIHSRAEDVVLKKDYLNSFNYVVARAVAKGHLDARI